MILGFKVIIGNIYRLIVALVEFDYEEAYNEWNKK
ncbi:hypothetical protein J2S21_000932 [Peribacillus cavernae]|nr:hypothetical protein [Peribacillus cavernae]